MANFWSKRAEPSPALSGALADLDRLGRQRPELETAARALGPVLIASLGKPFGPVHIEDVESITIHEPAFVQVKITLDLNDLTTRIKAIAQALRPTNPAAPAVAKALIDHPPGLIHWAKRAVLGELDEVIDVFAGIQLDGDSASSILRLGLLPQLAAWSAVLIKARGEFAWNRGDCPHCGGPPILAETRGLEAKRYLRCGTCAAEWPFERLRCPACDVTDHRKLSTRYAEGEGDRYKLAICEACGYRLKVVSTLEALTPPGLLVAELATLHLDHLPES